MLKSQNKLTKICAAAVIAAAVGAAGAAVVPASPMAARSDGGQVSVQNIAISDMYNSLSRSGSSVICKGKTAVAVLLKQSKNIARLYNKV